MSDDAIYLLAHFAKSQLWHVSTLLFGFFLTEACGMEPFTMGLVMAGSLLVNGVMDGALGRQAQRRNDGLRIGLLRQGLSASVTCLFFMAFCATPLLDPDQRLPWAIATILAFRISYAFVDVPQNAAVSLIAGDVDARCALLSYRNMASGLANMAVGLVAGAVLIHGQGTALWLAWAGSVSMLVCITAANLRRLAPLALSERPGSSPRPGGNVAPSGRAPISFAVLLASLAIMMSACSTFRSLEPYYAAFVGRSVGLLAWAAIGGMVSQPLWVACQRRAGTEGTLAILAGLLLFAALILMSPWRAAGVGAGIVGLSFGAGSSGLWLMLWTTLMAGGPTDHAMGRTGLFTCVSKLAQGIAMLLLGRTMAISSYRETLSDAWSGPSLSMVGALAAMVAACLILGFAPPRGGWWVSRTASDGRRARPHPAGRTIRDPDPRSS